MADLADELDLALKKARMKTRREDGEQMKTKTKRSGPSVWLKGCRVARPKTEKGKDVEKEKIGETIEKGEEKDERGERGKQRDER